MMRPIYIFQRNIGCIQFFVSFLLQIMGYVAGYQKKSNWSGKVGGGGASERRRQQRGPENL